MTDTTQQKQQLNNDAFHALLEAIDRLPGEGCITLETQDENLTYKLPFTAEDSKDEGISLLIAIGLAMNNGGQASIRMHQLDGRDLLYLVQFPGKGNWKGSSAAEAHTACISAKMTIEPHEILCDFPVSEGGKA